jgi:microcystin-dependent protein
MYPSATPPVGYLLCNGAEVSSEDYPSLFATIGHSFDTGAGKTTTFNLPDMRGRFVVGTGQNATDAVYAINDKGGEQTHVLATNEVGQHTHGIVLTDAGHTHTASATSAEHTHPVTDAGHSHPITDGGHIHDITDPGHFHTYRNYGTYGSTGLVNANDEPSKGSNNPNTDTKTTGISIDNHTTGITINNATTGVVVDGTSVAVAVTIDTAVTALSAVVGTTDVAVGHENRPPFIALAYIIRAL